MGRDPSMGHKGSKMGRAEAIQTWVVYFQRSFFSSFQVLSVSFIMDIIIASYTLHPGDL